MDKQENIQNNASLSVERLHKKASTYVETNPELALVFIDSAIFILNKNNSNTLRIEALYLKGRSYRMLENREKAEASILASLTLAVENNNNRYRVLNLEELAEIQYRKLNYLKADSILNEAELIANQNNYYSFLAAIYNNKAKIADVTGQKTKAIQLYLKTAVFFDKENDEISLATLYNNLGLLYRSIADYRKAIQYLKMALVLNTKNNRISGLAENYNNLGVVYTESDSVNASLQAYKKSQILYKQMGRHADLAKSYMNIANLLSDKSEFQQADKYYDSSMLICKSYKLDFGIILNEINRGGLYARMGSHQKAVLYLNSALGKLKKTSLPDIEKGAELTIADSYKALGDYKSALSHFQTYTDLKDTTNGLEMKKQIAELQEKYNIVALESKIIRLDKSVLIEKAKNWKLIIIGLIISIVVLISGFSFTLLYRKIRYTEKLARKEHEKTRLNLELKNKELITNALHLASLTEFSNQIAVQIEDVIVQTDVATHNSLSTILKQINSAVPQGAWKEFETRFERVHEVFFEKLLSQYPDLSPAEIKICSFLRLNLTTKDIAILTHRSIRTIEKQRMNIRKKMNLAANSNLETNLLAIF